MLDQLQPDIREMLDLARKIENYDATLTAMRSAGKAIEPGDAAHQERRRREHQLTALRDKWGI